MQILRRRRAKRVVRELYKSLLGREPDPKGANRYETLLLHLGIEAALPRVLKAFLRSEEYTQRAAKVAVSHVNARLAAESYQLVNGRPANHVVALGNFCLPSIICQDNGLRRYSLPFDWIFSTPQMVQECLADDFKVFLDRRHYRSTGESSAEHELYREKYGLAGMFAHKDPTREADYLYYVRCVNRLRQILSSSDPKLFWVIGRAHHDLVKEFPLLLESLELRTANFALLGIELHEATERGATAATPLIKTGDHALYRFTPSSFDSDRGYLPDKLDEWAVLRLLYRYKLDLKDSPWIDHESIDAPQPGVAVAASAPGEVPQPISEDNSLNIVRHAAVTCVTPSPRTNSMSTDQNAHTINTQPADAETIELLFKTILGRSIGNEQFKKDNHNSRSVYYWVERLLNSEEFKHRFLEKHGAEVKSPNYITDANYRAPTLGGAKKPSLVFVTGSCMTDPWKNVIETEHPTVEVRHQLFNNASELEDIPEAELRRANFQIVQIPLRSILSEAEYFSLDLSDKGSAAIEQVFQMCLHKLRRNLDAALKYNRAMGIPVFVLNFASPQANPLGFLLPKYSLFNFSYFVKELNRELYKMISEEKSVYMVDYDEITASLGKRFIQDDLTSHINHGSCIGETHNGHDIHLTPGGSVKELYASKNRDATLAVFNECAAYYNIVASDAKIKLVIFDLDGTLWRGVPADRDDVGPHLTEGWPLSILEAATFLKKRGILLAIASKNDPDVARRIWSTLYERVFPLSNFVSTKFSWDPKIKSIGEILQETNLLPGNCLFVDDNPIEREQAQLAFPDIKVISGPIYTWRRTLLWAAELQVPYVTKESIARTESIQGMMQREVIKKQMNESDYIRDLKVTINVQEIAGSDHDKFARSFELLNKTNQFNTTGKRWSEQELEQYFADGGSLLCAEVSDRLTDYGLTAVLLRRRGVCSQIVMSCRTFGLRVEFALFNEFLKREGEARSVLFRDTGKNPLCRKFLQNAGIAAPEEQVTADSGIALQIPGGYGLADDLTSTVTVRNGDRLERAA